jgi:hypothetical protein
MDKPEDVHCFNCGEYVGYREQGSLFWTCDRCGKRTQLNKREQPIEATPAIVHLSWKLHELDEDFHERQKKYRVYIPGGRGRSGTYFEPTPDAVGTAWLGPGLLMGLVGIVLLWAGYPLLAVAALVLAAAVALFLKKSGEDHAAAYYRLDAERMTERTRIAEEAARLIASTE